jgi:hypothetical protein
MKRVFKTTFKIILSTLHPAIKLFSDFTCDYIQRHHVSNIVEMAHFTFLLPYISYDLLRCFETLTSIAKLYLLPLHLLQKNAVSDEAHQFTVQNSSLLYIHCNYTTTTGTSAQAAFEQYINSPCSCSRR